MERIKDRINKKRSRILIGLIIIIFIVVLIIIMIRKGVENNEMQKNKYLAIENENSELLAKYISKGVTIGGVTGTLEVLDTSDATAMPQNIDAGKTAYVKGEKIIGTKLNENHVFEEDTTIKDELENDVRIPKGFRLAEDTAKKVEDGIVIEDDIGNQFVWIPAKTGKGTTIHTTFGDKTIVYQRTDFGKQKGEYSDYSEDLPIDEEKSINANGGYYIGRFEAGDKVSTEAGKMRVSGDSQTNELSIKKGQVPYNYATYENSKSLAEKMAKVRNYTGITKLISSYAWDTAINFIKLKTPDYAVYSPQGNYNDTSFYYANIGEIEKKKRKAKDTDVIIPTGQTTPVSNIYDMGGNCWERTSESNSDKTYPLSLRGGTFGSLTSGYPAGYRHTNNGSAGSSSTFRVTLFLKS